MYLEHVYIQIYICISVYCLYIVYKYLGMTPSGITVVLLLFFIFLVFPCFILFFCSSHLCILSCMLVPYGAFFINKEFEFEFKTMIAYLIVDVKINFLVHYIKIKTMTFMFTPLVSSDFSYVNITFLKQLYNKLYQNSISMI